MDGAGTLADRWALAAGRASNKGCNICHGPRLPGARLCAPCKAALKRARLETVADLIPRPSRALAEAEAARRQQKAHAAAAPVTLPHRRSWLIPAVVVLSAIVLGGGYLAQQLARPFVVPYVPIKLAPPAPHPAPSAVKPAPAPERPPDVIPDAKPAGDATMRGATPHPTAIAPKNRPPPKRAVEAAPAPSPPLVTSGASTAPPVAAPAPAPEAVPPAREAPPPDRWQVMADQIARCYGDGFFAGAVCEQRVRRQYCDGYWGQVAQCRSGVVDDHGG
ncbi:MAG: hypothetical protein ABI569_10825 [Casimicrobiaceae bacterium]